jgi:hypothetical protein
MDINSVAEPVQFCAAQAPAPAKTIFPINLRKIQRFLWFQVQQIFMFFKDIKRFFEVNSNETEIFKVNFKLQYEKFRVIVTLCKNLLTGTRLRSRVKKLRLRLWQKVAAPPAPAP